MMTLCFYRSEGSNEKGPARPSERFERMRRGVVHKQTLVRKVDSPWVPSNRLFCL